MIEKATTPERKIYLALKKLDNAMNDDGKAVKIHVQTLLKEHEVGYMYYVKAVIKEMELIGYDPSHTRSTPLIFWNKKEPMTMGLADEIMKRARTLKKAKDAEKPKKDGFDDYKKFIDQRLEALMVEHEEYKKKLELIEAELGALRMSKVTILSYEQTKS